MVYDPKAALLLSPLAASSLEFSLESLVSGWWGWGSQVVKRSFLRNQNVWFAHVNAARPPAFLSLDSINNVIEKPAPRWRPEGRELQRRLHTCTKTPGAQGSAHSQVLTWGKFTLIFVHPSCAPLHPAPSFLLLSFVLFLWHYFSPQALLLEPPFPLCPSLPTRTPAACQLSSSKCPFITLTWGDIAKHGKHPPPGAALLGTE